ncbi:MAG TPA: hypothetical protein EYQ42_02670 [Thiotrichaceae bacterium]|jgi:hypothetical protein|nr:hypothetical protein [Thiotrichaceae bacterium]
MKEDKKVVNIKTKEHAAKLSTIDLAELAKQGVTVQLDSVENTLTFFEGDRYVTTQDKRHHNE